MKQIAGVAILAAALGLGVAACKKAHDAGNDSMSVGGGRIVAMGSVGAAPVVRSASSAVGEGPSAGKNR